MSFDPYTAVVKEQRTFTYYLGNGVRMVLKGVGDCIEVAKQNKIIGEAIEGVCDGDDHSRRWNPDRKYWEYMYIDYV